MYKGSIGEWQERKDKRGIGKEGREEAAVDSEDERRRTNEEMR
jgi:hypothetical protein